MTKFFKWLLGICNHRFIFHSSVEEQNLRGGYDHTSHIYVCSKCGKREVREDTI
jgi:hypothetical protein